MIEDFNAFSEKCISWQSHVFLGLHVTFQCLNSCSSYQNIASNLFDSLPIYQELFFSNITGWLEKIRFLINANKNSKVLATNAAFSSFFLFSHEQLIIWIEKQWNWVCMTTKGTGFNLLSQAGNTTINKCGILLVAATLIGISKLKNNVLLNWLWPVFASYR